VQVLCAPGTGRELAHMMANQSRCSVLGGRKAVAGCGFRSVNYVGSESGMAAAAAVGDIKRVGGGARHGGMAQRCVGRYERGESDSINATVWSEARRIVNRWRHGRAKMNAIGRQQIDRQQE